MLPPGGPVYLLGGPGALSRDVENAVNAAGYSAVRLEGADRDSTALAVVGALGDPGTIVLTTGQNFPDALAAGAAAAHLGAGILMTDGPTLSPEVANYLKAHPGDTVYAIGGPAAAADPAATAIVGADRYDTAVRVAQTLLTTTPLSSPGSSLS